MSSAVISTSAAAGRPFIFADETMSEACPAEHSPAAIRQRILQSTNKIPPSSITPASQLEIRPAPEMASSGIAALDALTGGLPRGCLTEICGTAPSGRTTLLLAALAAATHRGEFCALVDASDTLDPHSAAAAGLDLERLLWVRCEESPAQKSSLRQRKTRVSAPRSGASSGTSSEPAANPFEHCLEQVLRATDLLLESGGFGLIVLDLADLPPQQARRIPLTMWFRFRRAIEHTNTILLAIEQQAIAGSCSSLLLQLAMPRNERDTQKITHPTHAQLLTGMNITAELICSRLERKPARSVTFQSKTAWAG